MKRCFLIFFNIVEKTDHLLIEKPLCWCKMLKYLRGKKQSTIIDKNARNSLLIISGDVLIFYFNHEIPSRFGLRSIKSMHDIIGIAIIENQKTIRVELNWFLSCSLSRVLNCFYWLIVKAKRHKCIQKQNPLTRTGKQRYQFKNTKLNP